MSMQLERRDAAMGIAAGLLSVPAIANAVSGDFPKVSRIRYHKLIRRSCARQGLMLKPLACVRGTQACVSRAKSGFSHEIGHCRVHECHGTITFSAAHVAILLSAA